MTDNENANLPHQPETGTESTLDESAAISREFDASQEITTIGGWLIVYGICLGLGLLISLVTLADTITEYLSNDYNLPVSVRAVVHLEIFLALVFFVFLVFVAKRFFNRHKSAPKLVIITFIFQICLYMLLSIFWQGTIGEVSKSVFNEVNTDYYASVFASVVIASIWIPYFYFSKRVKRTFVLSDGTSPQLTQIAEGTLCAYCGGAFSSGEMKYSGLQGMLCSSCKEKNPSWERK